MIDNIPSINIDQFLALRSKYHITLIDVRDDIESIITPLPSYLLNADNNAAHTNKNPLPHNILVPWNNSDIQAFPMRALEALNLANSLDIPSNHYFVIICAHGVRSKFATLSLVQHNWQNCFNFSNGLHAIHQKQT